MSVFFKTLLEALVTFKFISKKSSKNTGVEIVKKALQAPVRQITANAGVDGSVIVGKLKENKSATEGYDAQSDKYVDMFKAGIIDPLLVTKSALKNAASVATTILSTDCVINNLRA